MKVWLNRLVGLFKFWIPTEEKRWLWSYRNIKGIDVNKTSVYRMLSTFVQYGYVEQDTVTDRYKLGYKVIELSSALLESIDLRREAKPFLEELEQLTNEVIHLVVFDRGEVVYIEKLEGNETVPCTLRWGRGHLCTAHQWAKLF